MSECEHKFAYIGDDNWQCDNCNEEFTDHEKDQWTIRKLQSRISELEQQLADSYKVRKVDAERIADLKEKFNFEAEQNVSLTEQLAKERGKINLITQRIDAYLKNESEPFNGWLGEIKLIHGILINPPSEAGKWKK